MEVCQIKPDLVISASTLTLACRVCLQILRGKISDMLIIGRVYFLGLTAMILCYDNPDEDALRMMRRL